MQQLEPTYLRYVYDGLAKGSINSNNAAGLPFGFIGLFEDEFQANIPSNERSKLLRRLGVWALFKGAVSAEMTSIILDEHIDETKALIDRLTKWFNTPEPGKYVLYHDRLRTYLLQKLSDFEVNELNETLIEFLENALEKSDGSEAETYALEYLSTHMSVESQLDFNYQRLHDFANNKDIWQRQIKISKEYKWSQQTLQYGIKEGARRHHETNTLVTVVNSVKLSKDETNSSKQILNLLNEGDYKTALKRAESFDGERLFTFYLLMIHELTIGTSKNATYRVEACKEIIGKISNFNQTLKDEYFYPGLAIYKYHEVLSSFDINDEVIWDKLGFHMESILHLLNYNTVKANILEGLINRQVGGYNLIPIYVKKAEIYFNNNNKKQGFDFLDKALSIIETLKVSDGNKIYNDDESGHREYEFKYYEYSIDWLNYIFNLCYDKNSFERLIKISNKQKKIDREFNYFVSKNKESIQVSGHLEEYYSPLFKNKQYLIENLVRIGQYDSTYYNVAKDFNKAFHNRRDNEIQPCEIRSFNFSYNKYVYESALAKSLFKAKEFEEFEELLRSFEERRLKVEILLSCLNDLENEGDVNKYISKIVDIVDQMIFGKDIFYVHESFYKFLLKKGLLKLGEKYLYKTISLIDRLSDKNQYFYCTRISEIIVGFSYLNKVAEAEFYFKIYEESLLTVLVNKSRVSDNFLFLLSEVSKSNNLNCITHIFELITNNENYNDLDKTPYQILASSLFKNKEITKAIKLCKDNNIFPKQDYVINSWKDKGVAVFNGSFFLSEIPPLNLCTGSFTAAFNLNENIINELLKTIDILKTEDFNTGNGMVLVLLNELIEKNNYELLISTVLNNLSKPEVNFDKFNSLFSKHIFKNNFICKKLIDNLNEEDGMRVLNVFDFEENIPTNPSSLFQKHFFNATLNYLTSRLNNNNVKKILPLIQKKINSFNSSNKEYIKRKINNKELGYRFVCQKLKEKGFKKAAKIYFEKWLNETPKEILLDNRHHKNVSGFTIEMGWFCIDLFPKNEILKKIDTLIFDFSDNTTILLETCYLLIKIKEKKRAFILANSIPERIMVDPFIFEDLKQERLAQVALFLNKNGDSDKNETIDDPYNYHDYLNIDRDTNGFFDEIFDNNQDYTFIISNLNSPEFYPVFLNHKAKMACFFENKIDQNKINLLSEVINISEWKRISNQINLN